MIEEELHDARRVHSHGQEEDLRSALSMVIDRVSELSNLLNSAYKQQAELEVQLNVAKSNLQLVIANNEMLEDALKRDSGPSKDVGWRRTSGRDGDPRASLERSQSVDYAPVGLDVSPPHSAGTPTSSTSNSAPDNRFFKFRFSGSGPNSRPTTPMGSAQSANVHHLTSPSMPSLSSVRSKELEDLTAELEKEKAARKAITDEKAALEDELESLSQALFEEANNMVATERKMRAETEEELKELKQEKEALRSALRLIEGENTHLRSSSIVASPTLHESGILESKSSFSPPPSRSSSRMGVKSRPESLDLPSMLPPLPPSPSPEGLPFQGDASPSTTNPQHHEELVMSPEEESQPTPRYRQFMPRTPDEMFMGPSPWADVPSSTMSSPERKAMVPGTLSTTAHTTTH
ncbi:hypothetical protein B0H34DRAFT_184226 [Crassisporium funariophilum]|nr:hypothetical protein B0H34DRAFT_184226 [Crassisporium funariophilum]